MKNTPKASVAQRLAMENYSRNYYSRLKGLTMNNYSQRYCRLTTKKKPNITKGETGAVDASHQSSTAPHGLGSLAHGVEATTIRDSAPDGSVAGALEVDLDRAGVVQEPDDVGASRGTVREGSRRYAQGRSVSDLAQPPEAVARLASDVCTGGKDGGAEVAKPKVGGDQGVVGGEETLALRS